MARKRFINGVEAAFAWPLPLPENSCWGPAIVCGQAPGYLEEFGAAQALFPDAFVLGVNRASFDIDTNDLVTVHPEMFENCGLHVHTDKPGGDYRWPIATRGGTSALLGVCIALVLGFRPVVVAGVHLSGDYKIGLGSWLERRQRFAGKVCSVSPAGTHVRDILGGCDEFV